MRIFALVLSRYLAVGQFGWPTNKSKPLCDVPEARRKKRTDECTDVGNSVLLFLIPSAFPISAPAKAGLADIHVNDVDIFAMLG
jgi:hypothetical protein